MLNTLPLKPSTSASTKSVIDIVKKFKFNWDNMIIAGGAIASYFQDSDFRDIDIFIYGLQGEKFNDKVREIYKKVGSNSVTDITIIRSKYAITFINYEYYDVQIILAQECSPKNFVTKFDISASRGYYDGKKINTEYCGDSIETQSIVIDRNNTCSSYGHRLYKYCTKKGFTLKVDFDLKLCNPNLTHGLNDLLTGIKDKNINHSMYTGDYDGDIPYITGDNIDYIINGVQDPKLCCEGFILPQFKKMGNMDIFKEYSDKVENWCCLYTKEELTNQIIELANLIKIL